MFATTTNQGVSWSRYVMPIRGNPGRGYVAADPSTRDHYAVVFITNSSQTLEIWDSRDGGRHWRQATTLNAPAGTTLIKPGLGFAPNGTLGAVWRVRYGSASGGTIGGVGGTATAYDVVAMVSRDGGRSFSHLVTLTDGHAPPNTGGSDDCSCNVSLTNERMSTVWGDARKTDTNPDGQRQLWFASFDYWQVPYG